MADSELTNRVKEGRRKLRIVAAKIVPEADYPALDEVDNTPTHSALAEQIAARALSPANLDSQVRDYCDRLAALLDTKAALEAEEKLVRQNLSGLMRLLGQEQTSVPGFGKLEMRVDSTTTTYDARQLDALIARLVVDWPAIARAISDCRRETKRAGGLVVTREKSAVQKI